MRGSVRRLVIGVHTHMHVPFSRTSLLENGARLHHHSGTAHVGAGPLESNLYPPPEYFLIY